MTGSTGARNVGRRLGVAAAVATFAADVAKGAIAVGIALAAAGGGAGAAALVAVIAGHIAPVQLGFRGGRGLGPAAGGMPCSTGGWRPSRSPLRRSRPRPPARSPHQGSWAPPPRRSRRWRWASAGSRCAAGVTAAIVLAAHARRRPDQLQG